MIQRNMGKTHISSDFKLKNLKKRDQNRSEDRARSTTKQGLIPGEVNFLKIEP